MLAVDDSVSIEPELRANDPIGWAHTTRFRKVSTIYPNKVANAYALDVLTALGDTDAEVAARVAAWERAEGVEPRDWHAVGAEERDEGA